MTAMRCHSREIPHTNACVDCNSGRTMVSTQWSSTATHTTHTSITAPARPQCIAASLHNSTTQRHTITQILYTLIHTYTCITSLCVHFFHLYRRASPSPVAFCLFLICDNYVQSWRTAGRRGVRDNRALSASTGFELLCASARLLFSTYWISHTQSSTRAHTNKHKPNHRTSHIQRVSINYSCAGAAAFNCPSPVSTPHPQPRCQLPCQQTTKSSTLIRLTSHSSCRWVCPAQLISIHNGYVCVFDPCVIYVSFCVINITAERSLFVWTYTLVYLLTRVRGSI